MQTLGLAPPLGWTYSGRFAQARSVAGQGAIYFAAWLPFHFCASRSFKVSILSLTSFCAGGGAPLPSAPLAASATLTPLLLCGCSRPSAMAKGGRAGSRDLDSQSEALGEGEPASASLAPAAAWRKGDGDEDGDNETSSSRRP